MSHIRYNCNCYILCFIYLFGVLHRFQHCTGHIRLDSFVGRGKSQETSTYSWSRFCTVFIYLGFYVAFNTVQVISQRVVGRAEETSTQSLSGFCTVNCRPTASNYQLSHLRPWRDPNPGLRGGRPECYQSATVDPVNVIN